MNIRPATSTDANIVWAIIEPLIGGGEVFALDRKMSGAVALDYWFGSDNEVFVAEEQGVILGTYYLRANQAGGGAHIANAGYATLGTATGRGVARAMCRHSLDRAKERGFRAMQFNFVVSSNVRAVRLWESMGFEIVGRLPGAFDHPSDGFVDALVMFRTL